MCLLAGKFKVGVIMTIVILYFKTSRIMLCNLSAWYRCEFTNCDGHRTVSMRVVAEYRFLCKRDEFEFVTCTRSKRTR